MLDKISGPPSSLLRFAQGPTRCIWKVCAWRMKDGLQNCSPVADSEYHIEPEGSTELSWSVTADRPHPLVIGLVSL